MTGGVLVTRPTGSAAPLVRALSEAGHATRAVPTVAFEPVDPSVSLRPALADLGPEDWLVVTSPRGAAIAAAELEALAPTARPRVAVIGPGTRASLAARGVVAMATAAEPRPAALVDALVAHGPVRGRSVLVARSDAAGPELPRALDAAGARVCAVVSYRTIIGPPSSRSALLDALADPGTSLVHLASGSALRGALRLAGDAVSRLRDRRIVSIGPATSAAVRAAGLRVCVEAARPDLASQVAAVARAGGPA